MATISPTETDALKALDAFFLTILPAGVGSYLGQVNRVPEPPEDDFVIYWPLRFTRLNTNIDSAGDVLYTGSLSIDDMLGGLLSVSDIDFGTIRIGAPVFGLGVDPLTKIVAQISGEPGGVGVYGVSVEQTVSAEMMASGILSLEQHSRFTLQADVHGPNSADNAQIITTIFRDGAGVDIFAGIRPQGDIVPLYTSDPRQMVFNNEAQQTENRWVAEIELQVNQVVAVGQAYADAVTVGLISVDATYPP